MKLGVDILIIKKPREEVHGISKGSKPFTTEKPCLNFIANDSLKSFLKGEGAATLLCRCLWLRKRPIWQTRN